MGSGNPFAADSEVWKAASTPPTSEQAYRPGEAFPDPFGLPQGQPGQRDFPHAELQGSMYPPAQPNPQPTFDSFADLNPTALARLPERQQQHANSPARAPAFGQSYEQPSVGAISGVSSQTSTPKGKSRNKMHNPHLQKHDIFKLLSANLLHPGGSFNQGWTQLKKIFNKLQLPHAVPHHFSVWETLWRLVVAVISISPGAFARNAISPKHPFTSLQVVLELHTSAVTGVLRPLLQVTTAKVARQEPTHGQALLLLLHLDSL